jgi:ubiquinone/menaquinone biosynthesis C-methylase UbiE
MSMLRTALAKIHERPGFLALAQADATALPFATATFDVALVVHVFHLLPDWRGALTELLRVLRPGGYFLYGSERADGTGERDPFSERWRTILAQHGHTLRNHRSTDDDIVTALQEHGMATSNETIATWTRTATVQQQLERHASRDYSSSWSIPEPIFRAANAALAAWADEQYPDRNALIRNGASFRIVIARRD